MSEIPMFINPFFPSSDPEPILREVFPGWMEDNAIFDKFTDLDFELPWAAHTEVTSEQLNLEYFGNHSGSKFCAPLVKALLVNDEISDANATKLARIIYAKFREPWQRLWDTFSVTYNPIHNYNMTEEEETTREGESQDVVDADYTDNHTNTETVNLQDALTHGLVDSTEHGKTETTENERFGFNSSDAVPTDNSTTTEGGDTVERLTGTDNTAHTGTDANVYTGTNTENTTKDRTESESENRTLHRYGNIGVTTSQKMIADERDLWVWNYFEQIYNDIDSVLALMFYDPCRV